MRSVCRLPSSYLPLFSQNITAGRPSGDQGQPSCAVERPLATRPGGCGPGPGQREEGRTDVQDSQRSGPRDPHSMGGGPRGPRLGDWQHRGIRLPAAATFGLSDGHGTVGNRDCEKRAGGTRSCPLYETARWWHERTDKDKVRVSKRSDQRLCKQEDGILGG